MLLGPMGWRSSATMALSRLAAPPFTPPLPAPGWSSGARGNPTPSFLHKDPALHLGSLASALSFTDAGAVTLVSGDHDFKVNGSTVSGQAAGASDSNGTVVIPGVFQQLTFTLTPTFGDSGAKDGVFLQIGGTRPA
jgi:hypothetical protein